MQPTIPRTFAALVLVACLQDPAAALTNPLLGCWKGEKITQFLADGRQGTQASKGGIEFAADEIITRAISPNPATETRYRYEFVRPGVYTATITSHSHRPDLVGNRRDYEYKVEGDLLYITTYPQTSQPTPPTAAVRVESVSRRVACSTLRPAPNGPDQPRT